MKKYCQFRKSSMLSPIIVVFFLLISFGISHAFNLDVWFDNRINQYLKKNDGYFFILDITPEFTGELDDVNYVTAVNTAPDLYNDYETYYFEEVFFGNNILEIISFNEYKSQGGNSGLIPYQNHRPKCLPIPPVRVYHFRYNSI